MDNQLSKVVDMTNRGVNSAVNMVQKVAGVDSDPDLKVYNQLTPDDFKAIEKEFGRDATIQYVKQMEIRRMKQ